MVRLLQIGALEAPTGPKAVLEQPSSRHMLGKTLGRRNIAPLQSSELNSPTRPTTNTVSARRASGKGVSGEPRPQGRRVTSRKHQRRTLHPLPLRTGFAPTARTTSLSRFVVGVASFARPVIVRPSNGSPSYREVLVTGGFLALALLTPAAPPEGGLQKGDELTFTGTVQEAVERPGNRFRRTQKLEIRVFVLEKKESWTDAAVLTLLRRTDDAVAGAVPTITGGAVEKSTPPAARLDLVRIHSDGSAHHLLPVGPPPFVFDAKTPTHTLPAIPLDSFSPFEFGMFPPRVPRSAPDQPWTVASTEPNRSSETWQRQGTDFVTAERCLLLVMNQVHPNWAKPVGGHTAWHRADAVWVSTLDSTARKVHRVIRHRDGIATELAAWVEVKYELKEQTRVIGHTFDRYRRDVETAFAAAADVAPFLPDAVKYGPKFFATRIQKLDAYLEESDTSSPYREAVLAVRRQLDAARRGESVTKTPLSPLSLAPSLSPQGSVWPEPGQIAPDFTAGTFRLADSRGKPVVLVFFKPESETADLTLAIADALNQKYGTRAAIVPLSVWSDTTLGAKDRSRRKTTVPIYNGTQAETTYGLESVPRFVVIDNRGLVKWTFAGVGAETGYSVRSQLEPLLSPPSPNIPGGITRTPGTGTRGLTPRQ